MMSNLTPQNTHTSLPKSSLLDYLDEGRLTEWLSIYGKNLLYGLGALVALLIAIFAFSSGQNSKAEHQYLQAANDFNFLSTAEETQNPALVAETFSRLKIVMAKHPELHAAYDGSLAQIFLNKNEIQEATSYANATLTRVKSNNLTFYSDYATTTLLISGKDFKKALENAQSLQQKMKESLASNSSIPSFGDELFALNLLRIGMLQQEIGDHKAELATWQEWKQYAGLNAQKNSELKVNSQAFRSVIQELAVGAISLPDYFSYRENLLKK